MACSTPSTDFTYLLRSGGDSYLRRAGGAASGAGRSGRASSEPVAVDRQETAARSSALDEALRLAPETAADGKQRALDFWPGSRATCWT